MSYNVKNLLTPEQIAYSAAAEPGTNAIASFVSLSEVERLSGFPQWVSETADGLTPQQRKHNKLIFDGMMDVFEFDRSWSSFDALIEHLESREPAWMAHRVLQGCTKTRYGAYLDDPGLQIPAPDELLESEDLYLDHMARLLAHKDHTDREFFQEIHKYLRRPQKLKALVISHLLTIWDDHLAAEWKRRVPEVKEAVAAFKNLELAELSPQEAIRAVIGRDLMKHHNDEYFDGVDELVFVPSPHVGPYALLLRSTNVVKMIFGAQHADRFRGEATSLSRSELLSRLSALSDQTRLQILELLMDRGELNAQQIIAELDLSQSSASRHLIQLGASGFLTEKRIANSKYYALNRERVEDTIELLRQYFSS